MKTKHENYNIIFIERDKILKSSECDLTEITTEELNDIDTLRRIVMDIQMPNRLYLTTT